MTVLLKEAFDKASMLPEALQDEIAKELMADIRKKVDNDKKLSWEQTYREIAAEKENWDDFDIALMDGLPGEEFDSQKI
ncbi:MAG: AbrB/MazE/SpoVT family DNA-binding domain-containing protein [Candidatus Aminicenantes bacterium]|nr:MAG: AbrB/MazE/SpoVT family DNA-binding domain-containing protein [Candidatus Aminicenantes bacterium]